MGGDHQEFLDATLPYVDVVYQVARRPAGDCQDPEDLVQETYLRAYAAFGSFRGENPRAWLAAICLNTARSQARRRRRQPREVPAATLPDAPVVAGDGANGTGDVARLRNCWPRRSRPQSSPRSRRGCPRPDMGFGGQDTGRPWCSRCPEADSPRWSRRRTRAQLNP